MTELQVAQYMSREVECVRVGDTLDSVVRRMRAREVSGCPVVDSEGRLVGVISEVDLARVLSLGRGTGSLAGFLESLLSAVANETLDPLSTLLHRFRRLRVGACMSAPPISTTPEATVLAAARLMRSHRVNRLPVVEGQHVVGILSRSGVLRAFADLEDPPGHGLAGSRAPGRVPA